MPFLAPRTPKRSSRLRERARLLQEEIRLCAVLELDKYNFARTRCVWNTCNRESEGNGIACYACMNTISIVIAKIGFMRVSLSMIVMHISVKK